MLRIPKRYSLHLYLGPKIPLGRLWPSVDDDGECDYDDNDDHFGGSNDFLINLAIFWLGGGSTYEWGGRGGVKKLQTLGRPSRTANSHIANGTTDPRVLSPKAFQSDR